jgi:hypothetical protein
VLGFDSPLHHSNAPRSAVVFFNAWNYWNFWNDWNCEGNFARSV